MWSAAAFTVCGAVISFAALLLLLPLQMVSRELEKECVVVFDEAHNIDNVCIEALSVNLRQHTLNAARRNIQKLETVGDLSPIIYLRHSFAAAANYMGPASTGSEAESFICQSECCLQTVDAARILVLCNSCMQQPLTFSSHIFCFTMLQEVRKAQAANRARLDEEYRRLVGNLVEAQQLRGGEEWLANPALPEDIVRESMPGELAQLWYACDQPDLTRLGRLLYSSDHHIDKLLSRTAGDLLFAE